MTFLRNCWYVAGFPDELVEKPLGRTFLNEPVVMYRTGGGTLVAMDSRCPHRFAPLGQGTVHGDDIQCPYHGLRFDPLGHCVYAPAGKPPANARLRTYAIVERYEMLWIWMGDPARADASLIPDFSYLSEEGYGYTQGMLKAEGNYQLLVDNLLDLSHAEFIHPQLSSDGWTGRNVANMTLDGDTIHVHNIAENDNILPVVAFMRPDMAKIGTTIQIQRWDAPSLIRLVVEFHAEDKELRIPSAHCLTPESETSTHYFTRGGLQLSEHLVPPPADALLGVLEAFRTEDFPMIEAQQRVLGARDLMEAHPAIMEADRAAVMARRILKKKIRAENGQVATLELADVG